MAKKGKKQAKARGAARMGKMTPASKKRAAPKQPREKRDFKTQKAHLFKATPRTVGTGGALPHKTDMSRVVKWPRYIRIQRQRAVLKKRLRIPPAVHQFAQTLDKNQATNLFALMSKYRPESKKEKKERLYKKAQVESEQGQKAQDAKVRVLKFGLKHITELVEQRKARLVVIAHDVDPIELVVWLPALCRQRDVPYCIVKGKARLGSVVHQRTTTCVAFTDLNKKDQHSFDQFVEQVRPLYNDAANDSAFRSWGMGSLGVKAQAREDKIQREVEREEAQKMDTV